MLTVPAFVWRYGPIPRGLILGLGIGALLGVLAWLDSGFLLIGLIVLVILGLFYGVWMSRRMSQHWPSAKQLSGPQREQVARAAREGQRIDDQRLTAALIDYRNGLKESAEQTKLLRWLVPLVLVVAVGTALWDSVYGTWGNAIVSVIYLAMLAFEVFWWPKRRRQLLENADRAVELVDDRAE
jgi:ABC-type glycerol-3-phosphate transport system permease component